MLGERQARRAVEPFFRPFLERCGRVGRWGSRSKPAAGTMDYRVTLTVAAPPFADQEEAATHLDVAMEFLLRLAPDAGPVLDATAGEPNVRITLAVGAADVVDAVT